VRSESDGPQPNTARTPIANRTQRAARRPLAHITHTTHPALPGLLHPGRHSG
jgi:hypothetical protein